MQRLLLLGFISAVAAAASGCARAEWTIDVRNEGAKPCTVRVELTAANAGGKGTNEAKAEVPPGGMVPLLRGTIESKLTAITATRDGKDQKVEPGVLLKAGMARRISIDAEGIPKLID